MLTSVMASAALNDSQRNLPARPVTTRRFSPEGGMTMRRFSVLLILAAMFLSSGLTVRAHAEARAYGRQWGGIYSNRDWERFYHYPYVYYPHNYWGQEYFKSSDSLYYRYPNEMRIPVYNKKWHNFYPSCRPYHQGHHFVLDIF